jgi:hypothetical protein
MSHNLFGDRFGDARGPAWHQLGNVFQKAISATKALKEIGSYEVRLAPAIADGVSLGKNAILRNPTTDDPETRVFGIVSEDYHLISPQDVCTIYDERVAKPIETIGALGAGETFFLSTQLPTLDVKGDEVENYLLISNPMTGLQSAEIRVTPVRVVCQNTLIASDRMATQKLKIVHDKHAQERLGEWLQETYEFAETTAKVLRDLFTEMAAVRMKDLDRREGAKSLFEGMGTGMDLPAAKGTLWGAYNAVVETEDYRRGRNEDQIGASCLFGERAQTKKRAFEYAVGLITKK